MNTITTSDASGFQPPQVVTAPNTAVAVNGSATQQQPPQGGVLELLSAAMAVIEASTTPLPDVGQVVNTVA